LSIGESAQPFFGQMEKPLGGGRNREMGKKVYILPHFFRPVPLQERGFFCLIPKRSRLAGARKAKPEP
jgi:hypothetical protein